MLDDLDTRVLLVVELAIAAVTPHQHITASSLDVAKVAQSEILLSR